MKTVMISDPVDAARFIGAGGLVAFPTETVYGLGANVFDEEAVGRIFTAKRRPADNPLIAHIADLGQIDELTTSLNADVRKLIEAFFPGPLTIVVAKSARVPLIATAGLDSIGIRMPRLEIARRFLKACGTPVVAPSANLSGRPSPTTWRAVAEDLDGRVDCILQGGDSEIGLESTVVDCTREIPILLRQGAVSLEGLQSISPQIELYRPSTGDTPRSPGLNHRHYAPLGRVAIAGASGTVKANIGAAYIGLNPDSAAVDFQLVRTCGSVEEYAHSLFEFFRECDRRGIGAIYCEAVTETGIGAALMDRIRRAAAR